MKKFLIALKKVFSIVLGLALLVFLIYGGYSLITLFITLISKLEKEIAAAIIAGTTTIIVSVISIVIAKYLEKKKSLELEIRNKKIPVYEEFVDFTFKILNREIDHRNQNELQKFFMGFTKKLLIWGSDDVIKKWSNYRRNASNNNAILYLLEDVLYSIRKDTGHKNMQLKKGDLLSLFVNDIDKVQIKN